MRNTRKVEGVEKPLEQDENRVRCKHSRLVKVGHEIVCSKCGLVLNDFELAPPPERIPKNQEPNSYGLLSFSTGTTTLSSTQRTEANIHYEIEKIISRVKLPDYVQFQATAIMKKLLRLMRNQQGEKKNRLTVKELAIVSVWNACKLMDLPVTMNEYVKGLRKLKLELDGNDILKLEGRINNFAKLPQKVVLPSKYIPRLVTKLEDVAEYRYLSLVERYAIQIARENNWVAKGRKPVLVAAASVLAADEILGQKIGAKRIAETANVGIASVTVLSLKLRAWAPPPPNAGIPYQLDRILRRRVLQIAT